MKRKQQLPGGCRQQMAWFGGPNPPAPLPTSSSAEQMHPGAKVAVLRLMYAS